MAGGRDAREVGGAWATFQRHRFNEPASDVARFVAQYWEVTWDLRDQRPYRQLIVPYPNVHLTFVDDAAAMVRGVARGHVVRTLTGAGRVLGVAFRPGCFRPFLGRPVSTVTDRSIPASAVFGPDVPRRPAVQRVEEFLRAHLPEPDPAADTAAAIVTRIAASPILTRVDGVARDAGLGVRNLQRLFADYVGVPPKWVIRRYRLHEVTERLDKGEGVDWAAVAADLGYADQAHLTRDFTKLVGENPTRYAERYPTR
jgi:AraC-like DNA-binding protein